MKGNYIILDNETGGIDINKNPITQFAAIGIDSRTLKEISRIEFYIQPYNGLEITEASLEATLVNIKDVEAGMKLEDAIEAITKFCKTVAGSSHNTRKPVIVGHNVAFDIAFLEKAFELAGKDMSKCFAQNNGIYLHIDTLQLSRLKWGIGLKSDDNQSFNLTNCMMRAGIEMVDAHGAMNDVLATKALLEFFSASFQGSDKVEVEIDEGERFRDTFKI